MNRVVIIVVKCILEEKNKILFMQEASGSSWKPGSWSLPGGKIDPNETYKDAIMREMNEETGLRVTTKGLFKIIEIIRNVDNETRLVHHYVFIVKRAGGKLKNPDHHTAGFKWFSKNELLKTPTKNLSEFYYKDIVKDYFKNKNQSINLSLIKILNTNTDSQFKTWSKT